MAITEKTRKLLWGKSGNRCAMCRHELSVDRTINDDESIIGDECHIISGKKDGPRHSSVIEDDKIDSCENLILLCRIHHKQVDDQHLTYTSEILRQIKDNHEKWVSQKLTDEDKLPKVRVKRIKENIPQFLKRLTTGKEILDIVIGAHSYSYDNDELLNEAEVKAVREFLDLINDWGDMGNELSPGDRVEAAFNLTQQIEELEKLGFWVFGANEKQLLVANGENSSWTMAIINVKRQTNKEIKKVAL
jgi:DNA-binding HxlR family transcriptional regulator